MQREAAMPRPKGGGGGAAAAAAAGSWTNPGPNFSRWVARPKGGGGGAAAAAAAAEDAPSTQQVCESVEHAKALAERVEELRGRIAGEADAASNEADAASDLSLPESDESFELSSDDDDSDAAQRTGKRRKTRKKNAAQLKKRQRGAAEEEGKRRKTRKKKAHKKITIDEVDAGEKTVRGDVDDEFFWEVKDDGIVGNCRRSFYENVASSDGTSVIESNREKFGPGFVQLLPIFPKPKPKDRYVSHVSEAQASLSST